MNNRIKDLAEQARREFLKLPTGYTSDQVGMFPQLMAKFAELIVRECAEVAYEYDAPKMSGPGMIIAGRIETHFGFDE
jgi:hypothetical protein